MESEWEKREWKEGKKRERTYVGVESKSKYGHVFKDRRRYLKGFFFSTKKDFLLEDKMDDLSIFFLKLEEIESVFFFIFPSEGAQKWHWSSRNLPFLLIYIQDHWTNELIFFRIFEMNFDSEAEGILKKERHFQ